MAKSVDSKKDLIIGGAVLLLIVVGLVWYGTVHTHNAIREAVAYDRAPFCGAITSPDCVAYVTAQTQGRDYFDAAEFGQYYSIIVRASGHSERLNVNGRLYEGVQVGDEVRLWRFHGWTVAVEHAELYSSTQDMPGPPYFPGLVGTLFWAAVFAGVGIFVVGVRRRDLATFDVYLFVACFVAALGILLVGFVVDEILNVAQFDPRLIYLSLALTPAAAICTALRAVTLSLLARSPRT